MGSFGSGYDGVRGFDGVCDLGMVRALRSGFMGGWGLD